MRMPSDASSSPPRTATSWTPIWRSICRTAKSSTTRSTSASTPPPPGPPRNRIGNWPASPASISSRKPRTFCSACSQSPKWRARPLKVTLWGNDNGNLGQLRQLIDLHRLHEQISYGGFADDIETLWSQHHGLLLPSRMEGNALSLIEAMMCGRVPITTNVGRAAELIDDNESGFVAPAATAELVDEVLERAWQRRHDWQAMGQRAARAIRQRHSLRPAEDFADRILGHRRASEKPATPGGLTPPLCKLTRRPASHLIGTRRRLNPARRSGRSSSGLKERFRGRLLGITDTDGTTPVPPAG